MAFLQSDSDFILRRMKHVDKQTLLLIHGFLNECCNREYEIPSIVSATCAVTYFRREYFVECGHKMKINDKDDTLSFLTTSIKRNTAYCAVSVDGQEDNKYFWRIKMLKLESRYNVYFGIDSCKGFDRPTNGDFTDELWPPHYCFASCGMAFSSKATIGGMEYGEAWGEGDVVEMVLDTKQKTLSFFVNGSDQGIAFNNIHLDDSVSYHMAISMCSRHMENIKCSLEKFREYRC